MRTFLALAAAALLAAAAPAQRAVDSAYAQQAQALRELQYQVQTLAARFDAIEQRQSSLAALGKPILGVFTPYHVGGADQLGETLATARTVAALAPGGAIHGITEGFKEAFHGAFLQPRPIGRVIPEGALSLGGLDFVIRDEGYGFAVELPAARLSATHLFGADCHSLLPSREALDAALAQCDALEAAGVRLILSTHHLPEGARGDPRQARLSAACQGDRRGGARRQGL